MIRRPLVTVAVVLAVAAPCAAREQTFRLEAEDGKEIAQHIPVPVDRPGLLEVEAEWTGDRSLRMWIEDHRGRSLARWGGLGAGQISVEVSQAMADPARPFKVRIRTIGRAGAIEGRITVRYPSLADPPEGDPPAEPAPPPAAEPPEPEAVPAGAVDDRPTAGTRWPVHLRALSAALEDETEAVPARAMLLEVARITREYVALGQALPPPEDPEGEPSEAELERGWALESLGREVSAMVRLADESGLAPETATHLRRLLANLTELARRREGHGERAEGVHEAMVALSTALDTLLGVDPGTADVAPSGPASD